MTLYRQIAILVTFAFVVLLTTVLVVSFSIIRNSAQQELYQNAQNSVSSISISLAASPIDQTSIETIINASFDNGNYETISFTNSENEVLYERAKDHSSSDDAPAWFKNIVNFDISSAKANVSSGWNVVGTLNILNDRDVVYKQLYNMMTNIIVYLGITCVVFLSILAVVFKAMLEPLKGIKEQAEAVLQNDFVIQKNIPWTKEFEVVVKSTNAMVNRFQTIFQKASQTLNEHKELLYNDPVMKIPNRRYFLLKATENLTDENGKNYGAAVIIFIKKADVLNQTLGYKQTDEFLYGFAQYIQNLIIEFNDSFVCRVNGAELVIMLPKYSMSDVRDMMQNIIDYMDIKLNENKLNTSELGINIASCEYGPQHNISELFSLIDYSLAQAKLLPQGAFYELQNNKVAIAKERWKQIIIDGFKNDSFEIMYRKVINVTTKEKNHNVISFALKDDNNESYFYGTLIAPVVELGMVQDVYMHIIKKVLIASDEQDSTPLSIQISSHFIESLATYENLKELFKETKGNIKKDVIFEIPESVINNYFENSMNFIRLFKEYGFGFGINNFMAYSDNYDYLKEVKPLFVKADEQYILDAQQNINVLKIVLDSIGVEFIATGVGEVEKLDSLKQKGVNIVAGAVVDKL